MAFVASLRVGARAAAGAGSRAALLRTARPGAFAAHPCCGVMTSRWMSTKYADSHEYLKMDGEVGTMGISDHAQKALGDVVHVDLPDIGDECVAGESIGAVESVKAASDVYSPINGTVVEINEALDGEPGLVNTSPLDKGWFIKIKASDVAEADALMDEDKYLASLDE